MCSFLRSFVCSSVRSSGRLFVRSCVLSFDRSFDLSLVCSFVRSFVRLLIRPFVPSFSRSFKIHFVFLFRSSTFVPSLIH